MMASLRYQSSTHTHTNRNVLPEYQDRLKNVFTHSIIDFSASPIHSKTAPRNMFPDPQMFGTNIRIDLLKIDILGFIHIPETTAVFMYFCILNPPPNGWARISGSNEKCWVVHTSQKLVSPPSPLHSVF